MQPADSNQLQLHFRSISFFRNNEYMNPFYKGYTLIGMQAEPSLSWQAGMNTRLTAGYFFLRYSGQDIPGKGRPVFRVEQRLGERTELLMGSLSRSGGHMLPHAVYSLERNLNDLPEEGLQFFFRGDIMQLESWLSWDQFLLWGENRQERLSGGVSARVLLGGPDHAWYVRIPAHLLASHRGGQIDISPDPIQTTFNLGIEPAAGWRSSDNFLEEAGLRMGIYQYHDASPLPERPFISGYALHPALILQGHHWKAESGFWNGNSFYSPKGDPLFWNIAFTDGRVTKTRKMSTSRIELFKETRQGIKMGLQAEFYYDLKFREPDYSYSFYLIFSDDCLLWKR